MWGVLGAHWQEERMWRLICQENGKIVVLVVEYGLGVIMKVKDTIRRVDGKIVAGIICLLQKLLWAESTHGSRWDI
jgi:L-asparaginase II